MKLKTHITYLMLVILGVSLMFLVVNIIETGEVPSTDYLLKNGFWVMFYTIPLYVVNSYAFYLTGKNLSSRDSYSFFARLIAGLLFSFLLTLITGAVLFFLNLLIDGEPYDEALNWVFSKDSLASFRQLLLISGIIAIVMYLINYFSYRQEGRIETQKEKTIQISTAHESLKSQVGPHFLFNSLNVLNGLISEDSEKAQEFVGELSSVYRYVLEQNENTFVPLKDEISFAKTYMNLIKMRYEDGLDFEILGMMPEDVVIAPLSLQILLENCIKHNRISSEEPLKINVKAEGDYLYVINNLQVKKRLDKSTGKGLHNIRERYESLSGNQIIIKQNQSEFKVGIPLLKKETIKMETYKNFTEKEYEAARKRVEEIQGFYWNISSYVIVNIFLTFLDLRDGSYDWAFWPLLGWGIGITFHAIEVYGFFNSSSFRERMIIKELEKRKREMDNINSKTKRY